jgi:hypothetical protein
MGSIPTAPTNFPVASKELIEIARKGHCCILVQSFRKVSVFSHTFLALHCTPTTVSSLEPARLRCLSRDQIDVPGRENISEISS